MSQKVRQSNFELLRIVAMFMVLMLHADYAAYAWPKPHHVLAAPGVMSARILMEQFAIPAVDIFVLISGWFGIRATALGATKLLFQVVFVSLCAVACSALYHGGISLSFSDVVYGLWSYWFVWAYLILMVLSPILNSFLQTATRRQLEGWMLTFFGFAAVNLIFKFTPEFNLGYSALFFIGLYLLGYYLRHYLSEAVRNNKRLLWTIFLTATLGPAIMQVVSAFLPKPLFGALTELNTAYCNPVVVVQAASLLLLFSHLKFQSRFVNIVAASSFSVYVFHQNNTLLPTYFDHVHAIGEYPQPWPAFLGFIFLCFVFSVSVLIDRLRIMAWNFLQRLRPAKFATLMVSTLLLTGCGKKQQVIIKQDAGRQADTLRQADLRLALLPTADCLPFYYAKESGIYERLGLQVALETYQSQNDCDSALLGHADGGYVDTLRLTTLTRREALQVLGHMRTACGLVSAASLRLRAAKDLEGRVIAMAPRSLSEQSAYAAVRSGGLSQASAMYPHVTSFRVASDMVLQSQVDAAALPEPFLSAAVRKGAKALYQNPTGWGGAVVVKSQHKPALPDRQKDALLRGYDAAVDSLNRRGIVLTSTLLQRYAGIEKSVADSLRLPKFHHVSR